MHEIYLIAEAEEDIFEIYRYVAKFDAPGKADHLFAKLQEKIDSLAQQPARGHIPPELARINVADFLEIHYKPYRIIYQILDKGVFVHGVFDGRRDLQQLLQHRLLRT